MPLDFHKNTNFSGAHLITLVPWKSFEIYTQRWRLQTSGQLRFSTARFPHWSYAFYFAVKDKFLRFLYIPFRKLFEIYTQGLAPSKTDQAQSLTVKLNTEGRRVYHSMSFAHSNSSLFSFFLLHEINTSVLILYFTWRFPVRQFDIL